MARMIKEVTNIGITLETLMADPGDIICYDPGSVMHRHLEDYDHWPVAREVFKNIYRPWDEPIAFLPNTPETHLMEHGCKPFYKWVGVWALKLPISIYVQSLESPEPVIVPKGHWLCIGTQGEPYHMADEKLRSRYLVPANV